jgi:hypothetical protein
MEGSAIVRRMRSIVKEQFSEIERMQAAHFLIENANRMAHLTRKPADEAIQSMADGEHIAGVLSRLAAEAYALGYSEAVAALFPGVESSEAPVGRNGRLDTSSPRSQDWPDTTRRFDRDQGAPDETPS